MPPRRVYPKPLQRPHPPIWVACQQPATYQLAAEKGIGVLAFASNAPATIVEHVKEYKKNVKRAQPVGEFINDQWANFTVGYCGEDNKEARELGAQAIKSFLGPGRPYTKDRAEGYRRLLEAWGGVPDHLQDTFQRGLGKECYLEGGASTEHAMWEKMDADTLCDRGVIVAGDVESCVQGVKRHQEAGADQVILLMQCDQIPHEKVMRSIERFGTHVAPKFS